MLGDGTPALKLPTNRPLVLVRDPLPGWDRDAIWGWLDEAYNRRWGAVCDLRARRIFDLAEAGPADVVNLVTVADLGGGGVLADQMLPYTNARVLVMRINSRIKFVPTDGQMASGTIDPVRMITHEGGHFLGFQHLSTALPRDLMEPYILQEVIRPQAAEAKTALGWFGPPVTLPPVPPTDPCAAYKVALAEIQALAGRALA